MKWSFKILYHKIYCSLSTLFVYVIILFVELTLLSPEAHWLENTPLRLTVTHIQKYICIGITSKNVRFSWNQNYCLTTHAVLPEDCERFNHCLFAGGKIILPHGHCMCYIISHYFFCQSCMVEPAFDDLRTKKQLGCVQYPTSDTT